MLQKIVAFENAFDRLLEIIAEEGYSDGGKYWTHLKFDNFVQELPEWSVPDVSHQCQLQSSDWNYHRDVTWFN